MYKLGSLVCAATFEEPAFQLSQQSHALQRALFRNLRGLDPRIDNFSETGVSAGVAHWSLTLTTPGVNFRARTQGLETTFLNPGREILSSFKDILEQVESSIAGVLPEVRVLAREFAFNAHFELPPAGYQALTGPFLGQPPEGLGVLSAQGMSFYFHTPEAKNDSAIILDRSVVVVDGLYFQARSRFDSQYFDLSSSFSSFGLLLARAIETTNLGGAF